jgi:hypothetical protein
MGEIGANELVRGVVDAASRHRAGVVERDCLRVYWGLKWWEKLLFNRLRMSLGIETVYGQNGDYLGIRRHGKWLIGDGHAPRWTFRIVRNDA